MKSFVVLMIVAAFAVVMVFADGETKYSSKYDNINVKEILQNDRLLKQYIACMDGTGKCTPDGEALKKHSKEALENCCKDCTDKQMEIFKEAFTFLKDNKPDLLKELKAKYDPKGEAETRCKGKFEA